jgi:hypothetical protein
MGSKRLGILFATLFATENYKKDISTFFLLLKSFSTKKYQKSDNLKEKDT